MNGLNEIHANDRRAIVLAYRNAILKRDAKLTDNIRWAHPDLKGAFDATDAELSAVSA